MKRVITLVQVLAFLMVALAMVGCSGYSKVPELRQEYGIQPTEPVSSDTTSKIDESNSLYFFTIQCISSQYKEVYELIEQLRWYKFLNMSAQSTNVNEEALIVFAKECAAIQSIDWAKKIATSICSNPSTSVKVVKELENSKFYSVVEIAHTKLEELS